MKPLNTSILLALGALSLGGLSAVPSHAVEPATRYAGMASSSVAGCPQIAWRLAKDASGDVRGMVWYDDLSGLSKAVGTARNGVFHVTLTSVMGQGPVGTVDGHRSGDGTGEARMVGQGCANMTVKMEPLPMWGGTG